LLLTPIQNNRLSVVSTSREGPVLMPVRTNA
jgi:hypothetical protein